MVEIPNHCINFEKKTIFKTCETLWKKPPFGDLRFNSGVAYPDICYTVVLYCWTRVYVRQKKILLKYSFLFLGYPCIFVQYLDIPAWVIVTIPQGIKFSTCSPSPLPGKLVNSPITQSFIKVTVCSISCFNTNNHHGSMCKKISTW